MNHTPGALILAINWFTRSLFLSTAITASLLWHANSFSAELYKWVDDKGQIHYSDSVPPEAINKKRDVIDQKGIVVDEIGAAKTKAQLEEDKRRKAREAIKKQQQDAIHQHDLMLLETYNNDSDIVKMRERKLAAINDIITINQNRIDKLKEDLVPFKKQIAAIQKSNKEIPGELRDKVKEIEDHIAMRVKIIQQQHDEQDRLRDKFQQDLERFRYLTRRQAPGQQVSNGSGSPPPHP